MLIKKGDVWFWPIKKADIFSHLIKPYDSYECQQQVMAIEIPVHIEKKV
jgi:hypothetical protein